MEHCFTFELKPKVGGAGFIGLMVILQPFAIINMNYNGCFLAPHYPRRTSTMDSFCEAARVKKTDKFFDKKWDYKIENKVRAKRTKKDDGIAHIV